TQASGGAAGERASGPPARGGAARAGPGGRSGCGGGGGGGGSGGGGGGWARGRRGGGPWPAPQGQAGPRARTARSAAGSCAQYKAPKRNGPGEPGPVTCDQRRSDLADVLRLQALGTLSDLELHRIALGKAAEALSL